MWEIATTVLSIGLPTVSAIAGWFVRTHSTKLSQLEGSTHELDKRLATLEERSHSQKNTIVEIKDELAAIRSDMVRREDVSGLTEAVTELIASVRQRRRN